MGHPVKQESPAFKPGSVNRGESNFALIASKLGSYKVLITPVDFSRDDKGLTISKVDIAINTELMS